MKKFGLQSILARLLVVGMSATVGTALAAQSDNEVTSARVGTWNLTCEPGICQAFFGIQHPTEDWQLLRWSIFYDKKSGTYTTVLRTPTGVALPPGLRIWTAAKSFVDVPYQVCDPLGCEAVAIIDDDLRAKLNSTVGKVTIAFVAYGEQQPTTFEVSIDGFEATLKGLPGLK